MKAYQSMKETVITVNEQDTIRTVVERFITSGISGVPVVNDQQEVVGYISDGDIMRVIGKHKDIIVDTFLYVDVIKGDDKNYEERVRHILTRPVMDMARRKVVTANVETEMEEIAATLGAKRIKKLPILKDGKLVGIISRGDVIRHSFKQFI
ncbi:MULTISPECIES: CBS domain-containing protein [Exiguobacterium]|uniref:CBS domain-containing protein n=1 Tax=Exiguobacterium antarcticum TaxID=132920 RepID=A0ABT6R0Z0_9BACL|nr:MULTISPECIES: CBS domain-containing protein [Exiguobacterium]AFS71879.1 CBS domain containing membrane protein [Exiguobacterium antarcticum B7]MCT4781024.1 CBS domain-containing protein [Exiguobacterium soli]MDI3234601.1 CBS domain-containing protein [Exiguobacterium antarcticum]